MNNYKGHNLNNNNNNGMNPLHRRSNSNNSNNSNNSSNNERNNYRRRLLENHISKPIGYPFVTLKAEMNLYDKNINSSNPFKIVYGIDHQFNEILNVHVSNDKIDDNTYEYMKILYELKNKMMYPFHIINKSGRLKNKDLVKILNELITIYKKMERNTNNVETIINQLWVYYDQNTKLIDLVFSIYQRYLKYLNDIEQSPIREYIDHNKTVIEEFIIYLIKNGADISNLNKHIITTDYAFNDNIYQQLYNVLLQGFLQKKMLHKSANKKMTLKNYTKLHVNSIKNVKKVIHQKSAKKSINKLLNNRSLSGLPGSIIKSYLK
jgi:hypothetical protein